jgi:hypothetical protein
MLEDEIKKINLKKSCKVKKYNNKKKGLSLIGKKLKKEETAKKLYLKNHIK